MALIVTNGEGESSVSKAEAGRLRGYLVKVVITIERNILRDSCKIHDLIEILCLSLSLYLSIASIYANKSVIFFIADVH